MFTRTRLSRGRQRAKRTHETVCRDIGSLPAVAYPPYMLRTTTLLLIAVPAVSFCGCDRSPAPAPEAPATRSPQTAPVPDLSQPSRGGQAPAARGILLVAGLAIPIPDGWEEVAPANPMRLAELQIPGDPRPTAITFITAGGDVRSNLDRWASQFSGGGEPVFATRAVNGMMVHTAEIDGTYRNMGEPPQEGFALRGAVVEGPEGLLFIKMTGPAEQITAESEAFSSMIDGIRPAGG